MGEESDGIEKSACSTTYLCRCGAGGAGLVLERRRESVLRQQLFVLRFGLGGSENKRDGNLTLHP